MDWSWIGGQLISRLLTELSTWLKGKFGRGLTLELPQPVNPIGRKGVGGGYTPCWSVKLRFIGGDQASITILELEVVEEGVGKWSIDELFYESGSRVQFPVRVDGAVEFWIRTGSPRAFPNLPIDVGQLSLKVRDHNQRQGKFRTFPLTRSMTRVER